MSTLEFGIFDSFGPFEMAEFPTVAEEVKGASMALLQRVARAGESLVEARVRVAFVSAGKARRIPSALRKAFGQGTVISGQ